VNAKQFITIMGIGVSAITGCSSIMERTVIRRATFDLDCEQEKIQLLELGSRTYGVRGCGKKATYLVDGVCIPLDRCQAVMNSNNNLDD